mmetsp:Transcript_4715/g.7101  ORF Transcript_4715/g.7101 Transcript_4715/m.7101 type:complete len:128 (-) Transcript_4715:491-874(-)|eukprot:CAMPEP_0202434936 /NCGR_PEP_ID=MMETSP1345-20130828/17007_1 /ASSEMBLY_ACC=CAM_ASM_000843 /TAXON_ID=342563 /ORGANISM="Fabrea Fabrea salina" /LENGTH=127 /DNA_ID=CAMNT_0049047791 /DNA_START=526 /DNA_END=909 /DNA_ORIENTATION=+
MILFIIAQAPKLTPPSLIIAANTIEISKELHSTKICPVDDTESFMSSIQVFVFDFKEDHLKSSFMALLNLIDSSSEPKRTQSPMTAEKAAPLIPKLGTSIEHNKTCVGSNTKLDKIEGDNMYCEYRK